MENRKLEIENRKSKNDTSKSKTEDRSKIHIASKFEILQSKVVNRQTKIEKPTANSNGKAIENRKGNVANRPLYRFV
jgi:hypothetical protein